jgi:hypothetical protein
VALFLASLCTVPAGEELITDRPDQTESPNVVPKGRGQLEVGFTKTREDESGMRTDTLEGPGTLLRLGLAERFELRLGWTGLVDEELQVAGLKLDDDGVGDTEVGAKYALRTGEGGGPEIAVLGGASLPTGDEDFSSDRVDPAVRVSVAHALTDTLGLGYNVGVEWETERGSDGGRDTLSSGIYTLALGIGVTDRLGAFVELFGAVPASAEGSPAHSLDGGATYLLRDNLQLDLAGGVGLSDAADDWFMGVGVSWRFPD